MPSSTPIDLPSLRHRVLGDEQLLTELLGMFRRFAPAMREALYDAVARADAAIGRATAHRYKGSARTISANDLATVLESLERTWTAGNPAAAAALMPAFEAELAACLTQIDALLGASATP